MGITSVSSAATTSVQSTTPPAPAQSKPEISGVIAFGGFGSSNSGSGLNVLA